MRAADRRGPFLVEDGRLTWTSNGETLVVEAWGADSVRIRASLGEDVVDT